MISKILNQKLDLRQLLEGDKLNQVQYDEIKDNKKEKSLPVDLLAQSRYSLLYLIIYYLDLQRKNIDINEKYSI